MKFKRPTLHVSILTLFLVFLAISAGTLTWYNYKKNSEAALDIADSLMSQVNGKVVERINSMFGSTFRLAHEASEIPQIAFKPEFMRHCVQWYLAESLLVNPHIYSVYIGYADGDFYQIISLRYAKDALRARLQAPEGADLAVRRVFTRPLDGKRIELWQFFDKGRRVVGSRVMKESVFDPRDRPWFIKATKTNSVVYTPVYVFASTSSMGMTVARRIDGPTPGVFGVDITLDELCGFFSQQKVGKSGSVFMFDSGGHLTAHPDPAKTVYLHSYRMGESLEQNSLGNTGDPLLEALSREIDRIEGQGRMTLQVGNEHYLMRMTPLEDKRLGNQYVTVAAKVSDFTGSMDHVRDMSLIFALATCLLAVPVAMYFSRIIASPLRQLAGEADEIRHFNLESPVDVRSNISEIADLTVAIKTMKSSLSTFGRYVPKDLVRQILESRIAPNVGGERRELTLLFTDIADFTSLSEGVEAEELMIRISEYLEALGSELLEHGGTIDKFIGDAIMAFWNAPVARDDHAVLACMAALRARNANEFLNAEWKKKGIAPMRTRFGLHVGDAVVGNVGSDDRMNYTAIGSSVNLASRLEGLNKHYGTQILASETVKDMAGEHFVFRTVAKVLPKGTTIPVTAYELMGGKPGECDNDLSVSPRRYSMVQGWEVAFDAFWDQNFTVAADMFAKLAELDPDDSLAAIMKEKALQYMAEPPGNGWDGVDVFKTK